MRNEPNIIAEQYRKVHPMLGASEAGANWGYFEIERVGGTIRIISSGDCSNNPGSFGWEHVSVSLATRCPNWEEMQRVKELFWRDDETVLQFHPKASEYVNHMPHCLHLWKRDAQDHELPPAILIAPTKE